VRGSVIKKLEAKVGSRGREVLVGVDDSFYMRIIARRGVKFERNGN
jgi:hypothetical protein